MSKELIESALGTLLMHEYELRKVGQSFKIDPAIKDLEEALKQEQPIKEVVVNADYREMWKQQVEMNNKLTAFLLAQPAKQEHGNPVAGVVMREGSPTLLREKDIKPTDKRLYTAQQKREFVSLTDDEINVQYIFMSMHEMVRYFEKKLKEKNT